MSWRTVLGACVGLLLPVPLVLLLGIVVQPRSIPQPPSGRSISPVLGAEERLRLLTYRRSCAMSSECEPPLGCLTDTRRMDQYCTDSQCTSDVDCPEGQRCQHLATHGDGPLVRFCIPVGVRQEGERCLEVPHEKEAACRPGLLCGGGQGWCARPCGTGDAASCPEGFFCADVAPEPLCLPTCEAHGCPEGQQCIRYEEGVSACAVAYGPACQQSPCPEGRPCDVSYETSRPGTVWLECVERCGEGLSPCSEGRICDGWHCLPPCTPEGPNTCAEGYRCKQRRPDRPWVCAPDW
jgi:hypothetical protein